MAIRFGDCAFDALRREVRRVGEPVHLSPHAFALLALLVESRPRAVSKDELLSVLWPGRFVTEASLAGLVAEIRRGIGDDAHEPRHLRTVHGFGYAFADGVTVAVDEDSVYRLAWGAREVSLVSGENVIGRDSECAIAVDDARVSRHHARIVVDAGGALLEDLGSKNGTWRNGKEIAAPESLSDGDEIRVGPAVLVFRAFVPGGATATGLE